jgi:hypothetical protein
VVGGTGGQREHVQRVGRRYDLRRASTPLSTSWLPPQRARHDASKGDAACYPRAAPPQH